MHPNEFLVNHTIIMTKFQLFRGNILVDSAFLISSKGNKYPKIFELNFGIFRIFISFCNRFAFLTMLD